MSLILYLLSMYPNRRDREGNTVLIEKRLHMSAGEESPFILPSEGQTAPDGLPAQNDKQTNNENR
jgi:hypothetical protein